MRRIFGAAPVVLLASFGVARAADLEVSSHVDAVTLYPDAALVTRIGEIDAPAGANRLIFRGLPGNLDSSSLRMRAEGESKAALGRFDLSEAAPRAPDNARELLRQKLLDQREQAELARDARAAELDMVKSFGRAGPAEAKALTPDQWDAAWKNFGAGYARAAGELREARRQLDEINAKLRALYADYAPPPDKAKDAAIEINAAEAGKLRVAVTYLIPGASWSPSYEARLETGEGKAPAQLIFERRANLSQNSGEDWSDVALTLTTIRAHESTVAPTLEAAPVDFVSPPRPLAMTPAMAPASERLSSPDRLASPDRLSAPKMPKAVAAEAETATPALGAFQASFVAPGRVNIPSGAGEHSILLASRSLTPALSWRVVPALDPRAFLSASFDNDGEAPLLAGPVLLFRDGAMIGQGDMADAAPRARLALGFGVDDKLRVSRAPVVREEDVSGLIGQNRTDTRGMRTILRNLHGFPVAVELIDRAPYAENAAIGVELLPRTTPPDEKDVEGQRGVMAWRFMLAPNDSKTVELAYRVKWPENREINLPSP